MNETRGEARDGAAGVDDAERQGEPGSAWRRAYPQLQSLYEELAREVARLGPVCAASGRCCRFREYGHVLFLTALEREYLLENAPAPARELDDGATCPWQDANRLCTAREGRPLSCRVYYCDPSYQAAGEELGEAFLGKLKQLIRDHDLPWNYARLHEHLKSVENRLIGLEPSARADGFHEVVRPPE